MFLLLCNSAAHAINPNDRISQYGHTAWRLQDGAFKGSPTSIAQTKDGYIWVGTRRGLLRFDGVAFTPWENIGGPASSTDVTTLLGSRDGSLWIGSRSGLLRWKNNILTHYPDILGLINDIREDKDGSIWVSSSRIQAKSALCKVGIDSVQCYGKQQGIPFAYADHSLDVPSGILVVASGSLGVWKHDSFQTIKTSVPQSMNGLATTGGVVSAPDGTLYLGLTRGGQHLGLQKYSHDTWAPIRSGTFDSSSLSVSALLREPEGTLWVGTEDKGLYRISGSVVDHYGQPDGLSSNFIEQIFFDHEGDLWVVTSAGVDMFRSLSVISYSTLQGMSSDRATAVTVSPNGTVAVSNGNSIDLLSSDYSAPIRTLAELPSGQKTSLLFDHSGRLWAGIGHDLYVIDVSKKSAAPKMILSTSRGVIEQIVEDQSHTISALMIENGRTHLLGITGDQITSNTETGQGIITKIAPGDAHDLYVADTQGQIARQTDDHHLITVGGASDHHGIADLQIDADGTAMATTRNGVLVINGSRNLVLSTANGLPCNLVYKILRTSTDDLWLYSDCGLIEVTLAEYERFLGDPAYRVHPRVFDEFQGALPGRSTFTPGGARSSNDLLYFANDHFLQVVDTSQLAFNPLPPPVNVERVLGDQRPAEKERGGIILPAHTHIFEVDYAGLSYVVPQEVRFRYKLAGWDKNWQEVGTRRQAFYTNIPPGTYTFQVSACNNSGIWNVDGTNMQITIAAAYYQTVWFRILCGLVAAIVIYLSVAWRMRSMAVRINERWAERISERERIARELHDTFFQGIQGILLRVGTAARSIPGDIPARASLEEALAQSQEVMFTGRQLVQDLRNTGKAFTLLDGLETVGREFQSLYPIAFQISSQGRERQLYLQVADELCKVGREAISNAFRHSNGTLITVVLDYDPSSLGLTIKDDGEGIDEMIMIDGRKTGHWGLPGMRERAARLGGSIRFESKRGEGATVEIRVPARKVYRGKRIRFRAWLTRISGGVVND